MVHKRKLPPPEAAVRDDVAPAPPHAPDSEKTNPQADDDPTSDPLIYRYVKRLPMRPATGKRDVNITRAARFGALKARVISLLDASPEPVVMRAMGAAIARCCDLALCVQAACGGAVALQVRTGTVVVYDDYQPLVEGYPEVTRTRNKSSIHITLKRTSDYV